MTNVQPSLAFDFTTATLNPLISFSRAAATATRFNSSGLIETVAANTPRFDFDSVTLACKGLLVESTRQNKIISSENALGTGWVRANVTINNAAATAPDGTNTANLITATTTGVATQVYQDQIINDTSCVWSIFVKRHTSYDTTSVFRIRNISTGVNISNGFITWATMSVTGGTITPLKDDWYRISFAVSSGITAGNTIRFYLGWQNNNNVTSGNGLLAWGMQAEEGPFATSYIPNTGVTQNTRNADVATITGANFSSFWQAVKGGASVLATPSTVSGIRPLIQFDDGTANEIIALRGNTTNPELYIVDGGTPQAQLDAGTITANTAYSLTGWWDTNDCKARQNSGAVVTDITATIPTVTQMRIGSDGTNYLNGHIATVNYYDQFSSQIYTRRKNKVIFNVI